jgi:hypothetical protein
VSPAAHREASRSLAARRFGARSSQASTTSSPSSDSPIRSSRTRIAGYPSVPTRRVCPRPATGWHRPTMTARTSRASPAPSGVRRPRSPWRHGRPRANRQARFAVQRRGRLPSSGRDRPDGRHRGPRSGMGRPGTHVAAARSRPSPPVLRLRQAEPPTSARACALFGTGGGGDVAAGLLTAGRAVRRHGDAGRGGDASEIGAPPDLEGPGDAALDHRAARQPRRHHVVRHRGVPAGGHAQGRNWAPSAAPDSC